MRKTIEGVEWENDFGMWVREDETKYSGSEHPVRVELRTRILADGDYVGEVHIDDSFAILSTHRRESEAAASISVRLLAQDLANALLRLAGEKEHGS